MGCALGVPSPPTPCRQQFSRALAHGCPIPPPVPAGKQGPCRVSAGTELLLLPPSRTCSAGKGPHSADKGGNVNTLPAPASQLSEVANASRANSSHSASCINCGGLKICRDISTSCRPAAPHFHSPHTPVFPLHLYLTLPWLPGSFLDHSTPSPHPSRRMEGGGAPLLWQPQPPAQTSFAR